MLVRTQGSEAFPGPLAGRQTDVTLNSSPALLPDETSPAPEFRCWADSLKSLSWHCIRDMYKASHSGVRTVVGGSHHHTVGPGKVGGQIWGKSPYLESPAVPRLRIDEHRATRIVLKRTVLSDKCTKGNGIFSPIPFM